jgi:hypothetical protein
MAMKIAGIDISLRGLGMVKFKFDYPKKPMARFTASLLYPIDERLVTTEAIAKKQRKFVYKNSDDLRRACLLADNLNEFTEDCDLVFMELPEGSQNASGMKSYGICIGVTTAIVDRLVIVTPREVKECTGVKNAAKPVMLDWAVKTFPDILWVRERNNPKGRVIQNNHHMADGAAAAVAGINNDEFKKLSKLHHTVKKGR